MNVQNRSFRWRPIAFLFALTLLASALLGSAAHAEPTSPESLKFDFGVSEGAADGFVKVTPADAYSAKAGFGFDLGLKPEAVDRGAAAGGAKRDFVTADHPFYFSAAVPEGNYDVTVTLGDAAGESTTTVKAESRRLMLENIHTAKGQVVQRAFTVNVRTPKIAGGAQVKLKLRENDSLLWDEKLTLEFSGSRPCVGAVEIRRNDAAVTVLVAGDSTVTDQAREPYNSWGQMLPRFFKPGVAIANHAESGESLRSFEGAGRTAKVLASIKPGDFLFIQFGHNDQKDKRPAPERLRPTPSP